MKIYPYSSASASAKALAEALGIKRCLREGGPIRDKDFIINWGCHRIHREVDCRTILNLPMSVAIAGNKLKTFKVLDGTVGIPEWTESAEKASEWLKEGFLVVAREVLTGHSGEGITILQEDDEVIEAPLYTKYIPKKNEYRIHVFRDNAFFIQRKARNKEIPDEQVNWQVRNHGNGFIFAHKDVEITDEAKDVAIMAVKTLGLDFGAVDLVQNVKTKKWAVLEVNTACGLSGETVEKYVEQFKGLL